MRGRLDGGLAIFSWLASAALLAPTVASAQEDPLEQAEQAYLDVDFARTMQLAEQALERGSYGRAEMVRIYRFLGVAAAALGDEARSREAYVRMFALDPSAELPDNLSPRLLQPLMEARGRWTARQGRFELTARRLRGDRGIELTLEDPLAMADRVIVFAGLGRRLERTELDARGTLVVPVAGLSAQQEIEYRAHVVDAHGNRLLELGTEVEPLVLAAEADHSSGPDDPTEPVAAAPSGGLSPWLAVASGALTLVSAGLLTWSIIDITDQHADYLAMPSLDKYHHGLELQTRTNAFVVTTAVLGVATAVLMVFTDWGGRGTEQARVLPFAAPDSVGVAVLGPLP